MLNSTRRNFLRNSTLAVGGLMLSSAKTEKHNLKKSPAIGCAPGKTNAALFGTIGSVRSGEWSDPSTWGGKVPQPEDTPLIKTGHTVVFDVSKATVEGVNVNAGGVLQFDASKSVSLESTKNIIIQGKLQMKP